MSEKKDPLQEILTSINNRLGALEASKEKSSSTESSTSSKPPHTHSANVEFDCPECQKEYDKAVVEKARPDILQEYREKIKSLNEPVICENCGEVVEKETEECPTCHGRAARRI
jgi:hypothetical protein